MSIKCFYKPNRTKKRVFTEKDAARVFCRVINNSNNLQDSANLFFEELKKCDPKFFEKYILYPYICPRIKGLLKKAEDILFKFQPFIRIANRLIDFVRSFLDNIERFVGGFFIVREGIRATRGLLDDFEILVDDIETQLNGFIFDLTDFGGQCNGSENQN
jgi:hypothetical protein